MENHYAVSFPAFCLGWPSLHQKAKLYSIPCCSLEGGANSIVVKALELVWIKHIFAEISESILGWTFEEIVFRAERFLASTAQGRVRAMMCADIQRVRSQIVQHDLF